MNKTGRFVAAPIYLTLIVSLIAGFGLFHSLTTHPAEASDALGTVIDPPIQLKDFTLTDQTGQLLQLSNLRGRAVVVFFGYTHCPDVCPVAVAKYTQVKSALGSASSKVAFVFISVDGK